MAKTKKTQLADAAEAALRLQIPGNAKRVKVTTEKGETKYKDIGLLGDTDRVVANAQGKPIVMLTSPGRRAKADPKPVNDTVKELVKRKTHAIDGDVLRQAAVTDPDSDAVLQGVLEGLTEEVASLRFERNEAERLGRETSQISVRRIGGLKAVAETWLKRKDQLTNKSVDPDSVGFKVAMRHVLETMKESMLSTGMRAEMVQTVFAKFSDVSSTHTWEAELKAKIKSA
jgi:hypothetical protein